ncbi:MAG TPA: hypothetical protein VFQ65_13035, partial [Kofleriaceae bacterium]|nr:hypothetical protein [Kofleriaceae bacterium]
MSSNGHTNGHRKLGGYFAETVQQWGEHASTKPWPDAAMAPLPPLRAPVTGKSRIDVAENLRGKH